MVFDVYFTSVHVIYVQFIVCSENNCFHMRIFLGCWCNTSYLSVGVWWWSQSSTNAKRFAGCQMGWWCWIRVNCHCYRYLFISSSLHVCLNYFLRQYITFRNWLQVGELFLDSKSWALKSLGRYKLTCLFFFQIRSCLEMHVLLVFTLLLVLHLAECQCADLFYVHSKQPLCNKHVFVVRTPFILAYACLLFWK
jgi:hypothetical protein